MPKHSSKQPSCDRFSLNLSPSACAAAAPAAPCGAPGAAALGAPRAPARVGAGPPGQDALEDLTFVKFTETV